MSPGRLALLGLLAVAATPFLAEGLVRFRAHAKYGRYLDIYEVHERLPDTNLLVPLPNLDVSFGETRVQTDERGFRSPPVAMPKPPGTLRLAFLGASDTFCAQVRDNERTWPALVQRELATRFPEITVEHVNAGVTSHRVADSLAMLEQRVAVVAPDVVVVYAASADLAVDTRALAEAAGLVEPVREPGWLEHSSLLWRLVRKNRDFLENQRAGRSTDAKLQCDMDALASAFEERVVALAERAHEVSDVVALVTFATKFARTQPLEEQLANMEQSFTFMSYLAPDALCSGFEAYNRAIARAAARTGALLIDDCSSIQGHAEYFADSVHFSELGCEAMAHRVAQGLAASESFQALVVKKGASAER